MDVLGPDSIINREAKPVDTGSANPLRHNIGFVPVAINGLDRDMLLFVHDSSSKNSKWQL
jgi:hypothetical protein